jgi:hypothetical protein
MLSSKDDFQFSTGLQKHDKEHPLAMSDSKLPRPAHLPPFSLDALHDKNTGKSPRKIITKSPSRARLPGMSRIPSSNSPKGWSFDDFEHEYNPQQQSPDLRPLSTPRTPALSPRSSFNTLPSVSGLQHPMVHEAEDLLQKSMIYFRGKPIGTIAAIQDGTEEALNYNQVGT